VLGTFHDFITGVIVDKSNKGEKIRIHKRNIATKYSNMCILRITRRNKYKCCHFINKPTRTFSRAKHSKSVLKDERVQAVEENATRATHNDRLRLVLARVAIEWLQVQAAPARETENEGMRIDRRSHHQQKQRKQKQNNDTTNIGSMKVSASYLGVEVRLILM
jgi:hypothetical protein